jgi:hypothetical protein
LESERELTSPSFVRVSESDLNRQLDYCADEQEAEHEVLKGAEEQAPIRSNLGWRLVI